jgi:hypothetical protein
VDIRKIRGQKLLDEEFFTEGNEGGILNFRPFAKSQFRNLDGRTPQRWNKERRYPIAVPMVSR